jgi:adenylyltransferase/sulfurtransferase
MFNLLVKARRNYLEALERYSRQMLIPAIGEVGQRRLLSSSVFIIGCGGLGCTIAQILVRAGIGTIHIAENECVEQDNLHRQILYDENDLGKSKLESAVKKLRSINSQVTIIPIPQRITDKNIENYLSSAELIVDATDNLVSRYSVNNAARKKNRDWIYGGCVGFDGTVMVIRESGACLECVFGPYSSDMQGNGKFPIAPSTPVIVGAIEANEVIRFLLAKDHPGEGLIGSQIISIDLERMRVRTSNLIGKNPECEACGSRNR